MVGQPPTSYDVRMQTGVTQRSTFAAAAAIVIVIKASPWDDRRIQAMGMMGTPICL